MIKFVLIFKKEYAVIKKSVKILLSLLIVSSFSYAGLVDGISIIVNDSPITLFEIRNLSQKLNVSPQKATQMLIEEKLKENLVKKYEIRADSLDIEDEMEKISSRAGMSIMDFQNYLEQQGVDIDEYKKDLAQKIKQQKLYKKIASTRIKKATQSEMKNFYKNNINLYSIPQMIDAIQYISDNRNALKKMIKNPMLNIEGISKKETILKSQSINPKLLYILRQTKEGSFTPILTLKKSFSTFYIKRKINVKTIPFDKVKNDIFARMMDKREKDIIKSYFDKLISEAQIRIIREPK